MCKNNKENSIVPGTRTIILDISEKEYAIFMEDNEYAKELIDMWIVRDRAHKLFPEAIFEEDYILKGTERQSKETANTNWRCNLSHPSCIFGFLYERQNGRDEMGFIFDEVWRSILGHCHDFWKVCHVLVSLVGGFW